MKFLKDLHFKQIIRHWIRYAYVARFSMCMYINHNECMLCNHWTNWSSLSAKRLPVPRKSDDTRHKCGHSKSTLCQYAKLVYYVKGSIMKNPIFNMEFVENIFRAANIFRIRLFSYFVHSICVYSHLFSFSSSIYLLIGGIYGCVW